MFSLQEFGELRYLWLKYSLELKRCHTYVKKDGKMVPTGSLQHFDALTRHDSA